MVIIRGLREGGMGSSFFVFWVFFLSRTGVLTQDFTLAR
jgi:hypothetical protein